MIVLPTPSVPELARIGGETLDDVVQSLIAYYSTDPAPFNYRTGIKAVMASYKGFHKLPLLLAACDREKLPQSKVSNREVVELAAPLAFGRATQVFELPRKQFPFTSNRRAGYRIPFFYVEGGVIKLYYVQPRKSAAPNFDQLGMIATIHKRFLLDTEFFGQPADVEYVDLSCNAGEEREVKRYNLSTLNLWSEERLAQRLTLIAEAIEYISANGLVVPRVRRVRAPDKDMSLFD